MAAFDDGIVRGVTVLAAVVDAGSFVAAGERLNMSQPGVSRAIARLEIRLGVRLFDRTTRHVALTDEGRRFYLQVMPLMAGLEEAAEMVAGGARAVRGRLRVNVDPFFSRLILGPNLGAFLTAHPDLHLELITRDQLGDLVADGFDLAVRFGEPAISSLVARKLLDTRILTVAAPAYLEAHGRPRSPMELQGGGHTCIEFRDPALGRPYPWEFHRIDQHIKVATLGRLMVNDVGTMHSACLAGYGIAQVMELGVETLVAEGLLLDLFPDWPEERFPLYALQPSRNLPPAKTRVFLDFIASLTANRRKMSGSTT